MKRVTEYLEYRSFLKDFYEEKRSENPIFSYRYMGQKLHIDPSHLAKIFQAKRHISDTSIPAFIAFAGLVNRDAEYFETLVQFNKAKSDRKIKQWYERLVSVRGINAHTLGADQYKYHQQWYCTAILMLLDFYKFTGDYKDLAGRLSPPITTREARSAVALLKRLDLIHEKPEGGYTVTHRIVTAGGKCNPIAVKQFQQATMRLAMETLERHHRDLRNVSTVTITIRKEDLPSIDDLLREFRARLLQYAEQVKEPDSVYQFNMQLFPLTR
jgi:uncharacterized protein (TIGR02147 family)